MNKTRSFCFTMFLSTAIWLVVGFQDASATIRQESPQAGVPEAFASQPSEQDQAGAHGIVLNQNYPNPFNPSTRIRYSISERQFVRMRVYNLLGIVVATLVNEEQDAGTHRVTLDGSSLPSGFYFCRLDTKGFTVTMRMILLR